MTFFREALADYHDLSSFDSQSELDDWLKNSARHAASAGTARTYVWLDGAGTVVAYFALAPHVVAADDMPKKIARGAPRVIRAILICKLALASQLQHHSHGYGGILLADAVSQALDGVVQVGGRLIVVDAIDERAAEFYENFGFEHIPGRSDRLVMTVTKAAASLGRPKP